MNFFTQNFSGRQIKALLRKDLIVRLRQPWMTILQIIWPIAIFLALYTFRHRFEEKIVPDCQFPTRLLPSNNQVLSFFHSYICTIENQCLKTDKYEDYTTFDEAPLKPVLNIVQTFLNDDKLYNAIYELPEKVNFVTAITTIATHPKFSYMENNIQNIIGKWPQIEKMVGPNFDIKKLFADKNSKIKTSIVRQGNNIMPDYAFALYFTMFKFLDSMTFSRSGNIICGRPFPRSDNIRFVENILDSEDFSSINDNELNDMPTKYCKKLYLDVTSTNRGKITWSALKPILQGKIIYGPNNNETMEIIKFANTTYEDMGRLQNFAKALNTILIKLRNDEKFKSGFTKLLEFARSPFVQMTVGGSVDINMIESIMKRLVDDQVIFDVIETVYNILQCFSVDRFITTENENNLQDIAHKLDEKNLFYAAVYFNQTSNKNIVYKIKVEPDNTPITLETKNRFWFPGPDASMELDLKYHRGFVQIKHSIDMGIIKYKKNLKNDEKKNLKNNVKENTGNENNWWFELEKDDDNNDNDDYFDSINSDNETLSNGNELNSNNESLSTTEEYENLSTPSHMTEDLYNKTISRSTMISSQTEINFNDSDELTTTTEAATTTTLNPNEQLTLNRNKRAPQFDGILGLLFGNNDKKEDPEFKINVNDIRVYTKQFPYPSYVKDDFKNGLYLAQAIQMAFFVALLIQIATCIRYRIWMKESKNTMLMRSMGLKAFSEILAWILTTFIEITIVFFLACVILYSGGILKYTGFMFLFVFLILFGLCTISFCFLCSTIFSSASVGSASSVILFLMTFMPYIIIICLDTKLSGFVMFVINLSFSTPFCYAWDYIMRQELQGIGTTFSEVFQNGFSGEFSYAFGMICLDLILYAVCAYLIERFGNGEFKFHSVSREDLDTNIGAIVQNASKIYENMKIAVSNITLEFNKNQITCLLGRNGAGKSTIIKMLTGQIKPSSGEVILSQALADQNQSDRIGLCSQDNILIPNLTAREHLEMYAKIKLKHGIQLEVMKIMNSLKFGKYENYKVCKLSGGYQRRLCVAIAFLGSPNVVILDEPCSGVDTRARKFVWDLIEILKKGRAVVLATHYLDEAEYLSDSVIILAEGKIVAKHSPDTLKSLFTKTFEINITHKVPRENYIHDEIEINLNKYLQTYNILDNSDDYNLKLSIPYEWNDQEKQDRKHNPTELLQYLENLQTKNKIQSIAISSKNLEEIFNNLNEKHELNGNNCNTNSIVSKHDSRYKNNDQQSISIPVSSKSISLLSTSEKISHYEIIKILLWKRLLHFKRNYRLLLSILVLPVIFEIIAMGFMQLRPGGEYDRALNLSKYELYPNSTEFIGLENGTEFINMTYKLLDDECRNCRKFESSERIFNWILDTNNLYPTDRYGGLTFNDTYAIVWYYNKGYHSMMAWLNDLNTHLLQAELNDTEYSISTLNQPIKLSERELTYSSILQQVSDAGVSLIILISFSLVVAGASVYIVNERITGEKLQQKLCGVDCRIYWGVAFIWDFLVLLLAVLLCVIVFECFKIPAYVAKSNLNGICLLLVLYGFALIPAVHIAEKLFSDPSFANMMIFCLNVVIALTTLTIIVMIDILGESDQSMKWRNFLNRAFLIFPQHALSDGLIEICKNYIVAEIFSKFDIDPYKSPITSNLLLPHFVSLTVLGIIFIIINYVIENDVYKNLIKKICNKNDSNYELKILSIQNSLKCEDKYRYYSNSSTNIKNEATLTDNNYNGHCSIYDHNNDYVLRVDNLYKSYNKNDFAVRNVSFHVKTGECFGLLGNNGAGKSTIFKILSGQLTPTSGHIHYRKNEIAYCPQTSALDPLLTVEECIKFYGRLRKINDIENLITTTLKSLHLDPYKNVLVKNLSGGNRRKLNVAVSCLGNVNLILMDEPTSDMDPVTRSLVYQKIVKLINEKKSILLTSHTISELEKVCHRITIIKEGKLISTGTPEELIQNFGGYYIVTIFHDKTDTTQLEMNIREEFPNYEDMQLHAHSIKFVIQIMPKSDVKTNDETVTNSVLSLSELFKKLKLFCDQQSQGEEYQNIIKFTIVRCRLDKVFEKILDSSKFNDGANIQRSATRTETTAA